MSLAVLASYDAKTSGATIWLLTAADRTMRWWCDECGTVSAASTDRPALRSQAEAHISAHQERT